MITRAQAEAIATAVQQVRSDEHPRWDRPGILAAIEQASRMGSAADILAALAQLARRADVRTPMLLPKPGPHWVGTAVAERRPPTMCGDHPALPALNCPECAAELRPVDHAAHAAQVRASLRQGPRYLDPAARAASSAERRRLAERRELKDGA